MAQPRVLFIRLGAIGDVVRTLPALALVRKRLPEAFIAWVVEERSLPILRGHPDLDEIFLLERDRLTAELASPDTFFTGLARAVGTATDLRRRRFTASLDFQGTLKSGLLARAAGAPLRAGYGGKSVKEGNHLFNNHLVDLPPGPVHRVARNLALLHSIGIDTGRGNLLDAAAPSTLPIGAEHVVEADRALEASGVNGGRPWVFIYPGSSRRQSYKRYPSAGLGDVARRLNEHGIEVVAGPGPGEDDLAASMRVAAGPSLRVLPPTSLLGMSEVIRRAGLFIGGDTGPMHIACLLGVPVVALFGPTDPALNAPWGRRHVVLDALAGAPRGVAAVRRRDPALFDALPPGEIVRATLALLEEGTPPSSSSSPGFAAGVPSSPVAAHAS